MERVKIVDVLDRSDYGAALTVCGWVRTVRVSKGGFAFISLSDGSTMSLLQVVADEKCPNYHEEIVHLCAGASLRVVGTLVASPGKGQSCELHAERVEVLGRSDGASYPMQAKRHSFEYLRTQAHLRVRTNTFAAVARVRNAMAFAIHEFFQARGFLYVATPIITASDCEGAGQMFRVTTLDAAQPPRDEQGLVDFSRDFFGRPTNLTVSGQLEAETFACALGDVYTFGPTFRAENSNTARHLAEFWMVEPEMAFCDLAGDADLAEQFVKHLFRTVLDRCGQDMAFFDERISPGLLKLLEHIVEAPFERLSYTGAIAALENSGEKFDYPVSWGCDLQSEHERCLTEKLIGRPVIVTDYPSSIKPFYMRLSDDERTVAAMDVLAPGIGEIIGGSQREERLDVLERRMAAQGLEPEAYWWYLDLRRYGTVPHAGFGLGFDRTVQFVTGMANIRDVIAYPRTPGNADF